MARSRRVHVPGIDPEVGDRLMLPADEAHHVSRVLRLRAGDAVSVFDGAGREWNGKLSSVGPRAVELLVGEERHDAVEAPLDVRLFQSLCRYDRVEWAIQKATEVGVRGIRVDVAQRSEVSPPPAKRLDRWRKIALEACKQSGRTRVPTVELGEALPVPPGDGLLALMLDAGPGATPLAAIEPEVAPREVWIAIGPEGGFAPEEAEQRTAQGWIRTGIGPRVLRTETAGVVAAALALYRWGDVGPAGAC